MTEKFTPGPWEVEERRTYWTILDEKDDHVAHVNILANAHLIAAAPDMFEALEIARNGLTVINAITPNYHTEAALKEINAALAKARGEATEQS